MNYKLIAVDLDDTLLDSELAVSDENKRAIRAAIDNDKKVVISTGRMYKSALPFAEELGITLPLVTYQGALVKDTLTGKVLYEKSVPLKLAREVVQIGYSEKIHINLYYNDTLFVDGISPEGIGYAKLAQVEMEDVGDLRPFLQGDPTKVLFIAEPRCIDRILLKCQGHFGEQLHITKSKPNYLEFMHPEANKGRALQELGRIFGIRAEEMIAVGDSYNDLDMIKYAGLGVAMGNAREEVKRAARYITLDNDNSGVAHVIRNFMLKDIGLTFD